MKINIPVRFKNPWFWVGLCGTILTAMGVSPEMFTSWGAVWEAVVNLINNPFMLYWIFSTCCTYVGALWFIFNNKYCSFYSKKQILSFKLINAIFVFSSTYCIWDRNL